LSLSFDTGENLNPEKTKKFQFTVTEKEKSERLDTYLSKMLHGYSRSLIQKYIQDHERFPVVVNDLPRKPHYRIQTGDRISVSIPEPVESTIEPAPIPLDILYEDNAILVINKQPGVPVHPSAGHTADTIVNALIHYLGEKGSLSSIGGELRPGIVHRLDKDTSGVLIIAKTDAAHRHLARQFAQRKTMKIYEAIVKGPVFPKEGVINTPIERSRKNRKKFTTTEKGRDSVTLYRVIDAKYDTSWVEFIPKTGRTHQIRVHALHIGHPIIGDTLYARKAYQSEYIALFAKKITIEHPSKGHPMSFTAPYPDHFTRLARNLGYTINKE
jgi:23S rRNA pseudouridine1911/1915/1917 synthase